MFIRFSDQENLSDYAPTSVNTAGTFRLDSGTTIVGAAKAKDYILIVNRFFCICDAVCRTSIYFFYKTSRK
jgi:hypothetical protein